MKQSAIHQQFESFEKYCDGILGVSAQHIESGNVINFNAGQTFLMCSTLKLPIAIYLLYLAEQNTIDLEELYSIRDEDLRPGFAFTLNDFDCRNGFPISYRNLLMMMLRESCNTATDIILRKVGGPQAVTEYLRSIGINKIRNDRNTLEVIAATDGVTLPDPEKCTLEQYKTLCAAVSDEALKMAKQSFQDDIRDSATPLAMTDLLSRIVTLDILTQKNVTWLLATMRRNKLYPNRLMGLLPPRTPVAHKTGTAAGYTNDVGIITLPHQFGHVAVSAFIKNSSKDKIPNERVLAEVGRTVYDYFLICS